MKWRDVIKEGVEQLKVTPTLVKNVRRVANKIAWDIAADLPADDQQLGMKITQLVATINQAEPITATMTLLRAELRPRDSVPDGITGVGAHWSWSEDGARVYHHDNADEHGKALVTITLVATVPIRSIDWVYTIATNLIHPAECEITIRNGASIALDEIYVDGGDYFDCAGRKVGVSGFYNDF